MNKTSGNKVHVLLSLLLTAVLVGTLLIKPAHILLVHHDLSELTTEHSEQTTLSNPHHSDCAICDFEFCFFISTGQVNVPKVCEVYANELTPQIVDCIVNQTSHHFQLRAPPVF